MTTSTTMRRPGGGSGVGTSGRSGAVGITAGTGTSTCDDLSTIRVRDVRISRWMTTPTEGVTVGGTSAGVGIDGATAGSGAAGGGSSMGRSSTGPSAERPKRPA